MTTHVRPPMTARTAHPRGLRGLGRFVLVVCGLLVGSAASASAPIAGTVVENQAAATYTACLDEACTETAPEEAVTSNLVETVIQQVAALALTNDQTRAGGQGSIVLLTHELVNAGNGDDAFELCIENVDAGIATWAVFEDADGDGQPDSDTPLFDDSDGDGCGDDLTTSIAPNGSYGFVIEVGVSISVTPGNSTNLTVRATSDFDAGVTQTNLDTIEVVAGPVIEVIKSLSMEQGPSPSGPWSVTLEYRNTSVNDAENLTLSDILPTTSEGGATSGMTYVASSATWSETGATPLTDADGDTQGSDPTIDWCAYDTGCADRARAIISSVPAGATGTITFQFRVDSGIPDDDRLLNDAFFSYQDSPAATTFGDPTPFRSNTVSFRINAEALAPDVVANSRTDSATAGADDSSDTDNVVTVAEIGQGERVQFTNVIWNTGDGSDVFDITIDAVNDRLGVALSNPFPAGTSFRLLRADGSTPLGDADADGTPDTGEIPLPDGSGCPAGMDYDAGAEACGVRVVLEAIVPATTTSADIPSGFNVTVIATSSIDESVSNAVSDVLADIVDGDVDVTNDEAPDGSAPGEGAGPEGAPVQTQTIAPGGTAIFTLFVTNVGESSDNYDLAVSDDTDFDNDPFAGADGFSAVFLDDVGGACAQAGGGISQTGVLGGGDGSSNGDSKIVCARVTVPETAEAGTTVDLYFRALSPVTGVVDVKRDRVVVDSVPEIDFINDEAGQVEPGGTVEYTHSVTNTGNVDLDTVRFTTRPATEDDNGWSVLLYLDVNDDGVRDAGDTYIEPGVVITAGILATLEVGESVRIFARVFAPANAAQGEDNFKTLAVSAESVDNDGEVSDQVVDQTTATTGDMTVLKEQALDSDCNGIADGPTVCTGEDCYQVATFEVIPAQECVLYRLTATNTGANTAFNVVIQDRTQPFTSHLVVTPAAGTRSPYCERPAGNCDSNITAPADGGDGDVSADIGSLLGGEQARFYFGLRVE